ncbi:hypothetical protein DPMN_007364 [Dreissena polymorpha]|uniref:Uncharacterized protein n=1 Tax=Dreissena polymorpha TaxID=45954 RepID=A0A9D4RWC8_DREPO|nr:hypothetical protein DPMN_007364 [Dreissena polymorpha]
MGSFNATVSTRQTRAASTQLQVQGKQGQLQHNCKYKQTRAASTQLQVQTNKGSFNTTVSTRQTRAASTTASTSKQRQF